MFSLDPLVYVFRGLMILYVCFFQFVFVWNLAAPSAAE